MLVDELSKMKPDVNQRLLNMPGIMSNYHKEPKQKYNNKKPANRFGMTEAQVRATAQLVHKIKTKNKDYRGIYDGKLPPDKPMPLTRIEKCLNYLKAKTVIQAKELYQFGGNPHQILSILEKRGQAEYVTTSTYKYIGSDS